MTFHRTGQFCFCPMSETGYVHNQDALQYPDTGAAAEHRTTLAAAALAPCELPALSSSFQLPPKARYTLAHKRRLSACVAGGPGGSPSPRHPDAAEAAAQGPAGTAGALPPHAAVAEPAQVGCDITSAASVGSLDSSTRSAEQATHSRKHGPEDGARGEQGPAQGTAALLQQRSLSQSLGSGEFDDVVDRGRSSGQEGEVGGAVDVLHRGLKAVRLTTSKIQGRAEPRKPRIGPQYQAVVPPWPPVLAAAVVAHSSGSNSSSAGAAEDGGSGRAEPGSV